jgi:sec-independent protein translocase protein TatC
MSVPEDKNRDTPVENTHVPPNGEPQASSGTETVHTSYEQTTDHDYDAHYHSDESYHDDPYTQQTYPLAPTGGESTAVVPATSSTNGGGVKPPIPSDEEVDEDDDGMLRMSFLEHLEELRKRIISILIGVGVAFAFALIFANEMWEAVSDPAANALKALGYPPNLAIIGPMDAFQVIYMKLPLLAAIFLSSPWVLWQVWSFIAPGLYKKERRFAVGHLSTAGLFVMGRFAYLWHSLWLGIFAGDRPEQEGRN